MKRRSHHGAGQKAAVHDMCHTKRGFSSKGSADAHIRFLLTKREDVAYDTHLCSNCGMWHILKKNK